MSEHINKYYRETSDSIEDKTDIDDRMYYFDTTLKVQFEVDGTSIGNRAYFSIASMDNNNKVQLPLIKDGDKYDVIIASNGIYSKSLSKTLFSDSILNDYSSFIDGSMINTYQSDAAIIFLYFDKTTYEYVKSKKMFLIDNTNAQMGNGDVISETQLFNSSANVTLNSNPYKSLCIIGGGACITVSSDTSEQYKYDQTDFYI